MGFDKKHFAKLLTLAKGDRSINKYGLDSGVDPGYISRLIREKIDGAPSAAIIKKLADKAYNGVTIDEFMSAAGYIDKEDPQKPKVLEGLDMFFMRAIGKLSPDGKKKVYDYIEMVDALEKQKKNKQKKN